MTPASPIDDLPFIDEHAVRVPAPAAEVWRTLVAHLAGLDNPRATTYVRLIGTDPPRSSGDFPEAGSTIPGFGVTEVDPPRRLTLTGRHDFSRYLLTFVLEPDDEGTTLRALSYGEFPGLHGRAYRAAVITSGAHRVIVRRLLRSVQRRSTRAR